MSNRRILSDDEEIANSLHQELAVRAGIHWNGREVEMSVDFMADHYELAEAINKTSNLVMNVRRWDISTRRSYEATGRLIYVGRPTKWGNPFVLHEESQREGVLRKFVENLDKEQGLIEQASTELPGKFQGCWCAPKLCHAHVWSAIANGGWRPW